MPNLQVLEHQADPSITQIQQGGEMLANTLLRKQALELTAYEYKIKAKQTQNEQDKLMFDEKAAFTKDFLSRIQDASSPQEKAALLKIASSTYPNAWRHMAEINPDIQANYNVLTQSPDAQEKTAKAGESTQQARLLQMAGDQMGAPPAQGTTQAGPQDVTPSSNPRSSVMGGSSMSIPDMNIGGVHMVNAKATADIERNKTIAQEEAKAEVTTRPIRKLLANTNLLLSSARKEMGPIPKDAFGAFLAGKGAETNAMIGKMPAVQAFTKVRNAAALAMGSYLNKGRPTEQDRAAGEAILPNLIYPDATNQLLIEFANNMLSEQLTGDPKQDEGLVASRFPEMKKLASMAQRDARVAQSLRDRGISDEEINSRIEMLHKKEQGNGQ